MEECEENVINKIRQRRDKGRTKYGVSMERTDLSRIDWLNHAQQEAMDLAIYLERLIRDEEAEQNERKGKRENKEEDWMPNRLHTT